jgi:hypothetical protein
MSNSESDPLLSNGPRVGTYSSSDVPTPSIELPISFQLFDISEDNKFLALIDTNLMLQVYELNTFAQTMRNIPCLTRSEHMSCIYISVASKTGHVAVSLLNMDTSGETFKEDSEFDKFAKFKLHRRNGSEEEQGQYLDRMNNTCRIYRGNEDGTLEKPFQGRAVFTKNRMVLIGRWTLDVYHTESLQKMYSFKPGSFYLDSYISFHHSRCYQIQNWYRSYFLGGEFADVSNTGYGLANISEHVRKNIIVVYDEDCSFYRRTSVKIWSISTGSLICSFMRNYGEYVISVSEDHSFLVTNDPRNSTLNIYCMKSGTRLHIYKPQGHKDYPGESTIMFVKLLARQNYMLIMGTTVKKSDRSNKTGSLFFEIFSIEQKAKVKYIETSTSISPNSMLALGIFQNEDFLNNPSQFHGVFWETANNGDRYLYFRTFSPNLHTNDPASNGLSKNRLWDTFDYTYIGTEEERGFKREWDIASYISRYTTIFYLFEKDSQKYVLLISPYVVQLWKLEIAANDSEIQTDTIIFFNNISRETKCYLDFSNSALIYTRSYYGLNYIYTLIGDDMKLEIEDKYDYQMPHVHFLGHKGHIFVYVESKCGSSISEEIILPLPLPEPQTETTSDSLCKIAHNNDDATDKVPEDNFYDIESCLLALLYAYWMHDKAFGVREYLFNNIHKYYMFNIFHSET